MMVNAIENIIQGGRIWSSGGYMIVRENPLGRNKLFLIWKETWEILASAIYIGGRKCPRKREQWVKTSWFRCICSSVYLFNSLSSLSTQPHVYLLTVCLSIHLLFPSFANLSIGLILLIFLIRMFLNVSLFLRERERQGTSGRGTEREGDTEFEGGSRLWAVSTEPNAGLEPKNREIMT